MMIMYDVASPYLDVEVHTQRCPPSLVRSPAGHQLRPRLSPAVPRVSGQQDRGSEENDQADDCQIEAQWGVN